jgi:hypothetical protein
MYVQEIQHIDMHGYLRLRWKIQDGLLCAGATGACQQTVAQGSAEECCQVC